ncbi:MAG: uracil-DNA glycosylase [Clostridia bacterium]|nr:uracil-DNA glycosylase [Clostridia bacterium]
MVTLGNGWDTLLKEEFEKEYYLKLRAFLKQEYSRYAVYPDMFDIFNALKYTDYQDVSAVILGQDPYHGRGQAEGLCFSVKDGVPKPPSLINIFKEYSSDLGFKEPISGSLKGWAKNGVLLLNTSLTVREGMANSHSGKGWELFTDRVITLLNEREKPIVFILWGRNARSKKELITNKDHLILEAAHPSPLSAYNGFFGCRHFSKANAFLRENGLPEIDWKL